MGSGKRREQKGRARDPDRKSLTNNKRERGRREMAKKIESQSQLRSRETEGNEVSLCVPMSLRVCAGGGGLPSLANSGPSLRQVYGG